MSVYRSPHSFPIRALLIALACLAAAGLSASAYCDGIDEIEIQIMSLTLTQTGGVWMQAGEGGASVTVRYSGPSGNLAWSGELASNEQLTVPLAAGSYSLRAEYPKNVPGAGFDAGVV